MNMKIIRASEAARQSEEARRGKMDSEMIPVNEAIMEAVMNGERKCYINHGLSYEVISALKFMGYDVESGSQYNETFVTIRW